MSEPTPTELLSFLQKYGYLNARQLQQVAGTNGTRLADSRALVRELVDRHWLTPYQASRLLQGQGSELLLGAYRLLDLLGEGGMGQVFKAHHGSMDRIVALKVILTERVSNPVAVERFYREVRAVAKLSHPNIVMAFDVNQVGKTHFLAMEYVDGIDLAKLVQQSGPLAIPQACEYIRQTAVGLQHAHEKGLIHRDIKPGNLIVARPRPDEPPIIKILDFGLARFESESDHSGRLTQLGRIVGTVDYIAPEQAQNPRTADIRADIYSLGCSLFYLLTGEPPFTGDDAATRISARVLGDVPSVRKSRPEVSPALEQALAKMTARDPAARYQTPGEVAKALELCREKNKAPSRGQTIECASVAKPVKPHRGYKREPLRLSATIPDRPVVPSVETQPSWPVTSEAPLPAQPIIRHSGSVKSTKGLGMLIGTLLAVALFGFSCLGLGTLFFAASRDKSKTTAAVEKETEWKPNAADDRAKQKSRFVGRWRITTKDQGTFYFILYDSFDAWATNDGNGHGKWEIVGNEARVTWDVGWKNILRVDSNRTIAFGPGVNWSDRPTRIEPAIKEVDKEEELATRTSLFLSELKYIDKRHLNDYFSTNGTISGRKFTVEGKESPHGLFVHPSDHNYSEVSYKLGRNWTSFRCGIAVPRMSDKFEERGLGSALRFEVRGDGKVLWISEPVRDFGQPQWCEVSIENVDVLRLRVWCPGSAWCTRAAWIEPHVDRGTRRFGERSPGLGNSPIQSAREGEMGEIGVSSFFQ